MNGAYLMDEEGRFIHRTGEAAPYANVILESGVSF